MLLSALFSAPQAVRLLRRTNRKAVLALLALLAAHILIVKPWLPHNIWHAHAAELIAWAEGTSWGMERLHGPAYGMVMRLFQMLTLEKASVFSINYTLALGSVVLLFATLQLLAGNARLSLIGSAMLLLLSTHMRISTTECILVLAEFLFLTIGFFLVLSIRTRRLTPLLGAAAACLVLTHLRAEMMLILPATLALYSLRLYRDLPRRPWVGFIAGTTALLAIPRALEILSLGDSRISIGVPAGGVAGFVSERGLAGISAFFDPALTPIVYPLLLLAGLAFLARKDYGLALSAGLHGGLVTLFYSPHINGLAPLVRMALATQFLFTALAAYGFHALTERFRVRARSLATGALFLLLMLTPLLYGDFLTSLYLKQQEYLFLETSAQRLPNNTVVVGFSEHDEQDPTFGHNHDAELLWNRAAARTGKRTSSIGFGPFLALTMYADPAGSYFYAGLDCHTDPKRFPSEAEHPSCRRMRDLFDLDPILETKLRGPSHSADAIHGDSVTIGFYRIRGRRRPPPERRANKGRKEYDWIRLAGSMQSVGNLHLAAAALNLAQELNPGSSDQTRMAYVYQDLGDYSRTLEIINNRLLQDPSTASLYNDLGVLKALSGRREEAISDLRRAIELEPGLMAAYITLGWVLESRGRDEQALQVYEEALRMARAWEHRAWRRGFRRDRKRLLQKRK